MTTSKTALAEKKEKTPELQPQEDVLAVGGELLAEPEDEQALPAPPKKKKFAEGLCFDKLVWIFVIGCIIGFIVETLWCYVRWGKIESRKGLIYGPFTPIYGFGGVLLTLALYKVRKKNGFFVFVFSAVIGAAFEFVCSWLQEVAFGTISWDYSGSKLNLTGRINFQYAIFWGLLGMIFIQHTYPFLSKYIERTPVRLGKWLTWIFVVFMTLDMLISAVAVRRWTDRQLGEPPSNVIEETLDEWYPDDMMKNIYPNMMLVEE